MPNRNRQVCSLLFSGVVVSLLAGSTAWAIPMTEAASSSFTYKYEMDVDPGSLDLDSDGNGDLVANAGLNLVDGIATFPAAGRFDGTAARNSIWQTSGLSAAAEWTIEVRGRNTLETAVGSVGYWGISISNSDGSRDYSFVVREESAYFGGAAIQDPLAEFATPSNVGDFVSFRLAQDLDGLWVWRENVLLNANDPIPFQNLSGAIIDRLLIGRYAGLMSAGPYDFDYVRLTAGAFAPEGQIIPNPNVQGDFNGDGHVDGADFVVWQTNFPNNTGTATLDMGDANADGNVDGADFVVWQTNFPFSPATEATFVPEPSAWILATLGILGLIAGRRWGQQG